MCFCVHNYSTKSTHFFRSLIPIHHYNSAYFHLWIHWLSPQLDQNWSLINHKITIDSNIVYFLRSSFIWCFNAWLCAFEYYTTNWNKWNLCVTTELTPVEQCICKSHQLMWDLCLNSMGTINPLANSLLARARNCFQTLELGCLYYSAVGGKNHWDDTYPV